MFERPAKTLKHSLFNVLENAQEYVADVCFVYPNQVLWAHRGKPKKKGFFFFKKIVIVQMIDF